MRLQEKKAFTLIELLVVITIIVVLLALLTPALDRAIYQAELAACGAQQKVLATGVTNYAFERRRAYPNVDGWLNWHTAVLAGGSNWRTALEQQPADFDMRALTRPYFPARSYLDPLAPGQVNMDITLRPDMAVESSRYSLWFGAEWPGGGAMKRLGDRLAIGEQLSQASGVRTSRVRFDVLVSDANQTTDQDGFRFLSSHPDDAGVLTGIVRENDDELVPSATQQTGVLRITTSFWNAAGVIRGNVDLNIADAALSFERANNAKPHTQATEFDESDDFIPVPMNRNGGSFPNWFESLPRN